MLTRALLALAAGMALAVPAGPAAAGEECPPGQVPTPGAGGSVICIPAHDDGTPPDPGGGDSSPTGCFKDNGEQVPCVTEDGIWFSSYDCYGSPYEMPADDPGWVEHEGETPYSCITCDVGGACTVHIIWVPGPGTGPPPDPGELAQASIGRLMLKTAQVNTAPQTPNVGVVGVETWLWVPASQWVPLSKTVTAGATTVSVSAVPERVSWHVGPETKVCSGPGSAWTAGMGDAATTSCGYTYSRTSRSEPDGVFAISARIGYRVDWVCAGSCLAPSGSLGMVDAPAGGGTLRVVDRQTVVVNR